MSAMSAGDNFKSKSCLVDALVKHLGKEECKNKPTVHMLLDFTRKTLPALRNAHLSAAGGYERNHKLNKSHKSLSNTAMLRRVILRDGLRTALHGTQWGKRGHVPDGTGT